MTPEQWTQVKDLLNQALDMPGDRRTAFMKNASVPAELIEEALSLLPYYEDATTRVKDTTNHLSTETRVAFSILPGMEGKRVGSYILKTRLGAGGMGEVYMAEWAGDDFQQKVAVKFIRQDMAQGEFLKRFHRERQILANLSHDHIARLYTGGATEDNMPYIIMEFVEGRPIHQYCHEEDLDLAQRVDLFRMVCDAVHYAHQNQVVHRDIKSANILVTDEGHPKLLDFGIAGVMEGRNQSREEKEARIFTPEYACPEQFRGQTSTTAGDIYSLGVLLYHLLTNQWPFDLDNQPMDVILKKVLEQPPTPPRTHHPKMSVELEAIILKCLEKDPANRYASAKALEADLNHYLNNWPVQAMSHNTFYMFRANLRRYKLAISTVLLILTFLGSAVGWTIYERYQAREQARLSLVFGQEAERIEALIRYNQMLPRHDASTEHNKIRNNIKNIEARIRQGSSNQLGYGDAALGRGYFALGDFQQALTYLESAWEKGFRGPRVSFSLARTYGQLFEQNLARVERETTAADKEGRDMDLETLKKELNTQYLKPALAYLRQARDAETEETQYAAALLSFYNDLYLSDQNQTPTFEDALEKAGEAQIQQPWFYEASELKGRIYLLRAGLKRAKGAYEEACQDYRNAITAYETGLKAAPSEPRLYLDAAQAYSLMIQTTLYGPGGEITPWFEAGKRLCQQAREVNPRSVHALRLNVGLHLRMAEHLNSSEASTPYLRAAVFMMTEALKMDPQNGESHAQLGNVYFILSRYGGEREAYLEKAVQAYEKALAVQPTYSAHNYLGLVYKTLASHKNRQGLDPMPYWKKAERHYQQARRLSSNLIGAHANAGNLYNDRANWLQGKGKDPLPDFDRALNVLKDALTVNPKGVAANNNMALTLLNRAEHLLARGQDPRRDLLKADEYYQKVIGINPDRWEPHIGRGVVWFNLAQDAWDRGGDPRGDFIRAEEANRTVLESRENNHWALNNLGHIDGVRAYHALMEGRDPRAFIQSSVQIHSLVLEGNGGKNFALTRLAHLHLLRARYAHQQGKDPRSHLAQALTKTDEILERNPRQYEPHLIKGQAKILEALWLLARDSNPEPAFQQARNSLIQALDINPTASDVLTALARWSQYRADWDKLRNPVRQESLDQGLAYLDKALENNPNLAQAKAIKGVLLIIKGEYQPSPSRETHLREGQTWLLEALALNPRLEPGYRPYLQRVKPHLQPSPNP